MSDGTPLPAGWTWASLGELLIGIEAGKSFKCQERPPHAYEVGVVKVSAVTWGEYQELESKTCTDTEMVNPALFIQAGDLLFSRANTIELVGACVIARHVTLPLMLSDKILRLKLARDSMKRWVLYLLRSDQGRRQIEALSSGNQESMRNIGQERIAQIRVPLPPFAEQTRVVEKLEELLSDLDAGVVELKAAQKKLALYRQSLLKAAVEGALTADWRARRAARGEPLETGADLLARILTERRARWEARQLAKFKEQCKTPPKGWQAKYPEPAVPKTADLPELPEGWVWTSVDALLFDIEAGKSFKCDERPPQDDETGVVKVSAVSWGEYDEEESKTCRDETLVRPDLFIREGDFLFSRANTIELVGACLIASRATKRIMLSDKILRFRLADDTLAPWLLTVLRGQIGRTQIQNLSSGNQDSMRNIGQERIRQILVPLPPKKEINEAERVLTACQEHAAGLAAALNHSLKQFAAQRKNLLKAAFSGQLVPQNPNDEPASALLARIRAERAASGHNTRRQRQKQETP